MALVVLAACSGSSSSSKVADHRGQDPSALREPRHTHAQMPPVGGIDERQLPACPAESDLAPRLRELWEVAPDAKVDVVACTRGSFGAAGWLVDAFIDTSDEDSEERVEILAVADWRTLAARDPYSSFSELYRHETGPGNTWDVVDLDGDGVDEMLLFQEWDQKGERSTTVAAYRVDGARIADAGSLVLSLDNQEGASSAAHRIKCWSQHGISDGPNGSRHILVDGRIENAGRRSEKPLPCPKPGAHRYGLIDGRLAEVRP